MSNKRNYKDLSKLQKELIDMAKFATSTSYAPYSKFNVGAAIRLKNGRIITGGNIENASYPLSLCAERVALATASSQLPNESIISMAIIASKDDNLVDSLISPCGACRQVISETENRYNTEIEIILRINDDEYLVFNTIQKLLPFSFSGDNL